jgi:hypothetical protein
MKIKCEDIKWPSMIPQHFCHGRVRKKTKAKLKVRLPLSASYITVFETELDEATADGPILCTSTIELLNLSDF